MKILREIGGRAPGTLALAVLLGTAGALCTTVLLSILQSTFLRARPQAKSILLFLGVAAAGWLFSTVADLALTRVSMRIAAEFRGRIVDRLLAIPLVELEKLNRSAVALTLIQDIDGVAASATIVTSVATAGLTALATLSYLMWISPRLTAAALVACVPVAVVAIILQRRSVLLLRRAREQTTSMLDQVQVSFAGAKELRLNADHRLRFLQRIAGTVAAVRNAQTQAATGFSLSSQWTRVALLLLVAVTLTVAWQLNISATDVGAFAISLLFLAGPLGALLFNAGQLARLDQGLERVRTLERTTAALPNRHPFRPVEAPGQLRRIDLDNIVYQQETSDHRTFTLGPITMTLVPGTIVMVVGGNGSGKSTLAKVICGLYPPSSGSIELDGLEVGASNQDWYSSHFSAIFTDFHLFEDLRIAPTLAPRVEYYLSRFALSSVVRLENGRLTAEKSTLSTGQGKRLALLLALVEDRQAVILDEWAADQDPQFRRLFYLEFLPELKKAGKLVIAITHDDRYFHIADSLVKMEGGRISSDATAEFIVRLGGAAETKP